jgi:hypothetical protein
MLAPNEEIVHVNHFSQGKTYEPFILIDSFHMIYLIHDFACITNISGFDRLFLKEKSNILCKDFKRKLFFYALIYTMILKQRL